MPVSYMHLQRSKTVSMSDSGLILPCKELSKHFVQIIN